MPSISRENATEATEVSSLLRPESIAIVGASDKSRWSETTFKNLTGTGFDGRIYLVNPRGGLIHGQQSFATCSAIGASIDLGIVLVPAHAAVSAIEDLGRSGARSAVVLTSGFAETGRDGTDLQRRLKSAAEAYNLRLLGPNSLGYINFADNVIAWATPIRAPSQRNGVAIVSQSGATAFFLAELAYQQGIGVSSVIATGNEVDVDVSTLVQHFVDDPHTRSIALFIETIRDPATFSRAAKAALLAGKAIVALKVGASEVTAKSAAAHTGALVGDDRVFEGLCRQFGIVRVKSIEELLATADVLSRTGVLRPGGLCIISNSGGICEIAADASLAAGISLPGLDDSTCAPLRELIPGFGTPHNPLDLTGAIEPEKCQELVRTLGATQKFAAVLCAFYAIPTSEYYESPRLSQLHQHLSKGLNDSEVPGFMVSYTPTRVNQHAKRIVEGMQAPYLACGLDRAIKAFAGAFWWSERQRMALTEAEAVPVEHQRSGERPLSERAALDYLARQGVPVVPATIATNESDVVAAAKAYGSSVVLKIASADIPHKSDMGGVALNLHGDAAVRTAYREIMEAARAHAPNATIDGLVVSPMRERGLELLVGVSRDPQWGLVLAVGLGGIWVEVLQDVSLRVLPATEHEIRRMLLELKGAKMLAGQRGVPAADLDAVVTVIAKIADAAIRLGPDLAEMDVNPLWVHGSRVEALDALFIFRDGHQKD